MVCRIQDLDRMLKDAGKNALPPNSVEFLSKTSLDFAKISEFLENTQANRPMAIVDAYRVCPRANEPEMNLGNRLLLWHGTPTRNIAGILSTGMQIRPAGVDVSGSRHGDGCYFADMAYKEQWREDGTCPLREGLDSVKALGRHYPDPAGHWAHTEGFSVPLGEAIVEEGPFVRDYNEYVVYSTPQVRLKYLLR
ncbi:hypothetical protein PRIPAC_98009, partial [Pristionchus pacificus]|uniref:Poly [ADP-ribose] polymerase n=1 Tax=Pristionchus pacificus TaxID=54126 RepID=A0A2A6CV58_PRIPA